MTGDTDPQDPLQRAIVELRLELSRMIDEQVAYLKERTEEIAPPRPSRPSPSPSPSAVMAEPPDEVARARALDPRQRLDALAKHLDNRRRLANAPAPERG